MWNGLLRLYNNKPPFSRDAAYQVWRSLNMNNWKLDPNPLDSAKKLIANASILNKDEGDTSKLPCIQLIENMENEDYECLAFCIPKILNIWHCWMKELVVDSACECN